MASVWVVTHDGKFLDLFETRLLAKASVDLAYHRAENKPIIVSENETETFYDNGIKIVLIPVCDYVNHL